jgi:hypothetical protein
MFGHLAGEILGRLLRLFDRAMRQLLGPLHELILRFTHELVFELRARERETSRGAEGDGQCPERHWIFAQHTRRVRFGFSNFARGLLRDSLRALLRLIDDPAGGVADLVGKVCRFVLRVASEMAHLFFDAVNGIADAVFGLRPDVSVSARTDVPARIAPGIVADASRLTPSATRPIHE